MKRFLSRIVDLLACGSREDAFRKSLSEGTVPPITSAGELELYVRHRTHDEQVAAVVVDAMTRTGDSGVVDVRRGGDGDPYSVKCVKNPLPVGVSRKQIEARIEQLRRTCRSAGGRDARAAAMAEMARLVPNHVTIWINARSDGEYGAREQLVCDALTMAREALEGPRSIGADQDAPNIRATPRNGA